jgi:ABC-type multidrug transport system fused ATPase/permease subunit
VALIGRSGAGKSTVVALLLRFFDPQTGRITLDGRNLREYGLESLRKMIAVVSQDTYLFYGSIADNLRLAKPAATEAELQAAAQAANIHAFISELPDGYNTIVGERGLRLSGGERQRIAIARALLKDAPILILDEATSSIDAANEAAIQAALERLTHGRTTLVIAHRLSTVANVDRIVVLEDGTAVECGAHRELLAHQGAYARLIAAQV